MRRFAALVALILCGSTFADLIVQVRDKDGRLVAALQIPPGGSATVTEGGNPTPPPNPTPIPPNPTPQPPANGVAKHMVLVRDDTPGKMSGAQLAALADPNLRASINTLGLGYSAFDVNSIEVQKKHSENPRGLGYAPLVQQAGGAPCLLFLDAQAHLVKGVPMPADAAGILAAAKEVKP